MKHVREFKVVVPYRDTETPSEIAKHIESILRKEYKEVKVKHTDSYFLAK